MNNKQKVYLSLKEEEMKEQIKQCSHASDSEQPTAKNKAMSEVYKIQDNEAAKQSVIINHKQVMKSDEFIELRNHCK